MYFPSHGRSTFSRIGRFSALCLIAIGSSIGGARLLAADVSSLVDLLPPEANAIAIVNVQEIMRSPRAQKENWAQQTDEKFLSGAGGIPSWVHSLVVGFLVRPSVPDEVWAAAVASVPDEETIDVVAAREGAQVEQLLGLPAARSRRQAYVVQLQPGILGVRRPAARQETARWVQQIQGHQSGLASAYLRAAAMKKGDLIMAIDLQHALDPDSVRMHLQANPQLAAHADALARVEELLLTLQGVTLTVSIDDQTSAELSIDFTGSVGNDADAIRDFFAQTLQQMGAVIDEFESASATGDGNAVVLRCALSDESLRRLLTLVTASPSSATTREAPPAAAATTPSATSKSDTSSMATATRKYFDSVNRILSDLQRANRRATNYERTPVWHENFARKIDDLPTRNVDPEMINYGAGVASRLRALARSLRGQMLDVNLQEGTLTYNMHYTPGWASVNVWGGVGAGEAAWNVTSNLQQVREKQAAAISAGASQRDEIWQMMQDEQTRIMQRMREKYGSDF